MRERDQKGRPDDEGAGNTNGAGGYAERGPGRGDLPGRGRGASKGSQADVEREASRRSRWRTDDPDGTSDRFEDDDGSEDTPASGGR